MKLKKTATSYHKFNIKEKTAQLISEIKKGKDIALVSDAGMPGISDPGYELVKEAVKNNIQVIPIPNTSALLVALSASGINTDRFIFEGFLPVKVSERKARLEQLKDDSRTIVFYEAPHRLIKTLEALKRVVGDRNVCVARELTKKFEEFVRGKISEQIEVFTNKKPKGEFVIVVEGGSAAVSKDIGDVKGLLISMVRLGMSHKDAVKIVSKDKGIPKNKLYKVSLGI